MKRIFRLMRKIIFAFILLYTYDIIAVSFDLMIPINIITIGILTLLDIPGLILLALINKLFFMG